MEIKSHYMISTTLTIDNMNLRALLSDSSITPAPVAAMIEEGVRQFLGISNPPSPEMLKFLIDFGVLKDNTEAEKLNS